MNWQVLDLQPSPQTDQLEDITRQLYQSVFAIDALLENSSETWARVAEHLNLTLICSHWLKQKNQGKLPLSLSPDEARSLVLIICHLARQNQALIRRSVNLVEQLTQQNRQVDQVTLLRDYLVGFSQRYQHYQHHLIDLNRDLPPEQITPEGAQRQASDLKSGEPLTSLALKSLINLLFYSQPNSPKPFWSALVI
jgi:hypothetical protein